MVVEKYGRYTDFDGAKLVAPNYCCASGDGLLNLMARIDAPNEDMKVLHTAAEQGLLEVVRSLLDGGADPNVLNALGQTPLHLGKTREVCRLLQEQRIRAL